MYVHTRFHKGAETIRHTEGDPLKHGLADLRRPGIMGQTEQDTRRMGIVVRCALARQIGEELLRPG